MSNRCCRDEDILPESVAFSVPEATKDVCGDLCSRFIKR
jgi:hypothetical protein